MTASMPKAGPLLQVSRVGAIAVVTLDEPERMNCLSLPLRAQLAETLTAIDRDPEVRVTVLTGAGGNFCAGGDIASMSEPIGIAAGRRRIDDAAAIVRLMALGSKPLVAAVEGWAAGAGLSLCMLCDTVVASSAARFKAGFGGVGLMGDMGLLHALPRRIGDGHARTMLLYGEPVDAATGLSWGLVDILAEPGTVLEKAMDRARVLEKQAPLVLAVTRAQLARGIEDVMAAERELQPLLFQSQDHAEGRTAFFERRPAQFRGQ